MEKNLGNYIGWDVKSVKRIKGKFGFIVELNYEDGSKKEKQHSGFKSKAEAKNAKNEVIAQLYNRTYSVYDRLKVSMFMDYWLENDIAKRSESYNTYSTFYRCIKNHIKPIIGDKNLNKLTKADIQKLYKMKMEESESVTQLIKTILNISLDFAVSKNLISINCAKGVRLPKGTKQIKYHTRKIDTQKTLRIDQVKLLIEKSKDTPIYMMLLLNVMMGLRRSEILAVKYSDVDFSNHTLYVQRQLGIKMGTTKEDVPEKMFNKQEIATKTESSVRILPIPDYVFDAICEERLKYEENRIRYKDKFNDLDYICCSAYGKPRSKDYHWKYFKKLLADNDLPDVRWHDLRSTFSTLLLKEGFSPKAVSKLMGHAKEIITIDVYGDNKEIAADRIPELEKFISDVVPDITRGKESVKIVDAVIDVSEYLKAV